MSVGPIPFSAIDAFASRYGLDRLDEFERLRALVRAMDGVFMAHYTPKTDGAGTPAAGPDHGVEVSVSDVQGVSNALSRLAARAATIYGDGEPEEE